MIHPSFLLRRITGALMMLTGSALAGEAGTLGEEDRKRLLAAYPSHIAGIEGDVLVFKDGTRMPLDDGAGEKPFEQWLARPDIADMFKIAYPAGAAATPPPALSDPGRARNSAFFDRIYGDCRKGEVSRNLVTVTWLPKRKGQRLAFNRINGAARALQAVSDELDKLPASFDVFLVPSAGTYNCRVIAGTDRVSAHGYAIAIDIALRHAHYWRDARRGGDGPVVYRNEIPLEIVRVFEKHGFIWGGRWYHYDTMHFEYRPELLGVAGAAD